MKYSDSKSFSLHHFRKVLATVSQLRPDFVENKLGCAVETLEEILERIHEESLIEYTQECNNRCIAHKFFGIQFCEEL